MSAETDSGFAPRWSGEIEVTSPSCPARLVGKQGAPLGRARWLVRAAGTPVGFLETASPDGMADPELTVREAHAAFGQEIATALAQPDWRTTETCRVSVVLCTHDRARRAAGALESIRGLRYGNFEVIVVDNAPSDTSTRDLVNEIARRDRRVRYVCEPVKGLSRARNRGLVEAGGEVLAFTDDDVRVDPLWLHGLMRGFDRDPAAACVTGLVATDSLEHPAEVYFDRRVWWSSSCVARLYGSRPGPLDSPLYPFAPGAIGTGANFAATAKALRGLGGFDQCLGAGSPARGGEDLDLFVRLLRSGHSIAYEPSALVWHTHRVDEAELRGQMYAYGLGLTAYLTKFALARATRGEVAGRALRMLRHAALLWRRSRQAGGEAAGAEGVAGSGFVRSEIRGMLAGPAAYLVARSGQTRAHLRLVAP